MLPQMAPVGAVLAAVLSMTLAGLSQPVANPAASRSDSKALPDTNYLATLEIDGQPQRLNLRVQNHRATCVASSDPTLTDVHGEFQPREAGVFLAHLRGRAFRASQLWILRTDGTVAIREIPDRGEQQSAVPTSGRSVDTAEDRAKRTERIQKERQESRFSAESETRRSVYVPFLTELGLQPDQIDTVLGKLDALLRGAVQAGDPMQELMIARADYQRDMRSLLGETAFARYEAFERSKPYRREAGLIETYAAERKVPMDPKFRKRLIELLQEFSLHTTESWDGPYDPAPRPLAGKGPVVASIDEYSGRITTGLPGFSAKAGAEFPPDLLKLVKEYYAIKLQEFAESRAQASMTPEERMAEMRRIVEENARKAKAQRDGAKPDL